MDEKLCQAGPKNAGNLFDDCDETEDSEEDEYEGRDPEYRDDSDISLDEETPDANWDEWRDEDPSAYEDGPLY